jgi:hypothetical protein
MTRHEQSSRGHMADLKFSECDEPVTVDELLQIPLDNT